MSKLTFRRAVKSQAWLRIALEGVAGSGKTWNGLDLASALAAHAGSRVAVIDTERGSSELYADLFDFDALSLTSYTPADYIEAIRAATGAGYRAILIDSISHEWAEVLKISDRKPPAGGWSAATPAHDNFIQAILSAPAHVICTMRQVARYDPGSWGGKGKAPQKIGEKPKQREGIEYEFSVVFDIEHQSHELIPTKTRCPALDGRTYARGSDAARVLLDWLSDAAPAPAEKPKPAAHKNGPLAPARPVPSAAPSDVVEAEFEPVADATEAPTGEDALDARQSTPASALSLLRGALFVKAAEQDFARAETGEAIGAVAAEVKDAKLAGRITEEESRGLGAAFVAARKRVRTAEAVAAFAPAGEEVADA